MNLLLFQNHMDNVRDECRKMSLVPSADNLTAAVPVQLAATASQPSATFDYDTLLQLIEHLR